MYDDAMAAQMAAAYMVPLFVFCLLFYIYGAVILMTLAKKTGTPNGWMAWVPIANGVLMCQIAGKSGWMILACMIPLVGIFVAIWLWMLIAERRGRPSWWGILMIIPIVNFIVPAVLAFSGPHAPSAPPQTWPPSPQPFPYAPPAPAGPAHCPACGTAADPGERFCGNCGQPMPAAPLPPPAPPPPAYGYAAPPPAYQQPPPPQKSKFSCGGCLLIGLLLFLAFGVAVWWFLFRDASSVSRSAPALPGAVSGLLREFPVDHLTGTPARPFSSTTQVFGSESEPVTLPSAWLPPGLPQTLPRYARSAVSAAYRTFAAGPLVAVTILETPPGAAAQAEAIMAVIQAGLPSAAVTGVELQSSGGQIYRGFKARSDGSQAYVVDKQNAPLTVVVWAPTEDAIPLADRLASNIGNSTGLEREPAVQEALSALPAAEETGLSLVETRTWDASDPAALDLDLGGAAGGAELRQALEMSKRLLPDRLLQSRYRDSGGQTWDVFVGAYPNSAKAWAAWRLAKSFAISNSQEAVVEGGDAITLVEGANRLLLLRKGASIAAVAAPVSVPAEMLASFAGRLQL
jgi:hypothetical protein